MSLPAQKARPRPATTSTRTSAMAATRSSASSSAPVSARLSALRASGRLSRSQATPALASSSTIGGVAIAPGRCCDRARPRAPSEATAPIATPTVAARATGQKLVRKNGSAKNGERPSAGPDGAVEESVDQRHRLVHEHLDGGPRERRVGEGGVAHVALAAVSQRVVRHDALGERVARRRQRAVGRVDEIGAEQQHQRRLPPAAVGVVGERAALVVGQRPPERGLDRSR